MALASFTVERAGTGVLLMRLDDTTYDTVIAPIVGATKLAGSPPDGASSETTVEGVKKGVIGSVKVSYKVGTKRKTSRLIVALPKLDTVVTELPGKAFRTGIITRVRASQLGLTQGLRRI
ncbi:hypothetical protein [Microcoleus sp. K5-D4]|uniref:hypothetical protein n=1 Tax=Microcoleus sp. K5-D4 TaxID=2818801 RepID=UPI002FD60906